METLLGLPPNVSSHGGAIDSLILYVHILMVIMFLTWALFFIYLLVRFRASKNPVASHVGTSSKKWQFMEVAVVLVEVVLLVAFAIPLYADRVENIPTGEGVLRINVIAEQYAWNFQYPGPDGIFGERRTELVDNAENPIGLDRESPGGADDLVTLNQLHLPVDTKIVLNLTSKDVIHCFNLPVMRVKQDIIPGMMIPLFFEAKQTIRHEITCAQLCGLGHYRMKGSLVVGSQQEHQAWLADLSAELADADDDDAW